MAKNNTAPAGRPDVASMPRQSPVAFADYVLTLSEYAPDRLEEIVAPDVAAAALGAIAAAGDRFKSTTAARVEKVIADKVEQAVAALTNDAELTGYANYQFSVDAFEAKTAPKTGRRRLSAEERAARVVEEASEEQLEALAALMKERGLA